MTRPLAIDLFTGLRGWAEGLIVAGFHVVGFDLEDMSRTLGEPKPDHFSLVVQNVLTVHGAQLKDAALIVGSSPCQEFSWRTMPWKRAKARMPVEVGLPVPEWWDKPDGKMTGEERAAWAAWRAAYPREPPTLGLELFHAQFRIQREASEAAGRHIPMVVENVRGAIPWVGRSRWNFGSYHLWGDVPALMPSFVGRMKSPVSASPRMWKDRVVDADDPFAHALHYPVRETARQTEAPEGYTRTEDDKRQHIGGRRKAASARIAKIPFPLAKWIGQCWLPREEEAA